MAPRQMMARGSLQVWVICTNCSCPCPAHGIFYQICCSPASYALKLLDWCYIYVVSEFLWLDIFFLLQSLCLADRGCCWERGQLILSSVLVDAAWCSHGGLAGRTCCCLWLLNDLQVLCSVAVVGVTWPTVSDLSRDCQTVTTFHLVLTWHDLHWRGTYWYCEMPQALCKRFLVSVPRWQTTWPVGSGSL